MLITDNKHAPQRKPHWHCFFATVGSRMRDSHHTLNP